MDILTALNPGSSYSTTKLQLIIGAWVLSGALTRNGNGKVSQETGHVEEDDYDKQSIYSLLYSMYRSIGIVKSEFGQPYEFTFNTWGYAWPEAWGTPPTIERDPQRFGRNAYTGLYAFDRVKDYVREREGEVHVVEMGCGTGAGANHVCQSVLPKCTYEAVDMQAAAIETCRRKFVPNLDGRLVATHADATKMAVKDGCADFVAVCETHVTEMVGEVTAEDKAFFQSMRRVLKPGGHLVWGNAIPDATWQPCFDYLDSIGMRLVEARDVTTNAIAARDQDEPRVQAYVEQCLNQFHGFKIPVLGRQKRLDAELALKNFYRNPGTNLYANMKDGTDSYKVVLIEKTA